LGTLERTRLSLNDSECIAALAVEDIVFVDWFFDSHYEIYMVARTF
jgi:hypothetical protein